MTNRRDPLLPEAPRPDAASRERTLAAALGRFDQHHGQGNADGPRRREAQSSRSFLMTRNQSLVAASMAVLIAAPVAWMVARERAADPPVRPVVERPADPTRVAERQPAKTMPPAEPPRIADAPPIRPPADVTLPDPPQLDQAEMRRMLEADVTAETRRRQAEAQMQQQRAERPQVEPPQVVIPAEAPREAPRQELARQEVPREASRDAPREAPRPETAKPLAPPAEAGRSGGTVVAKRIAPESRVAGVAPPPAPHPYYYAPGQLRERSLARSVAVMPGRAEADLPASRAEPVGRDQFEGVKENGFKVVKEAPVSTFSIDVDTASYSFMRGSLGRNVLPQPAAVRTEELINYFPYEYELPASAEEPFRTAVSVFPSPWNQGRKVVAIGIKGYAVKPETRPAANLVFLIDTSGSMNAPNRLPLVKQSLAMLLDGLDARDKVAIVTYAGQAGTALEPVSAAEKGKILAVIEGLEAAGSTAGGEGIRQAYTLAERNFDPAAVNRVILATDGDFNVGITSRDELKGFVERQRGKGIFLSILGFGMGNYNDALMQALAQNGNGAAAYIDTLGEARKVLVDEATSTLIPIAKDVKIQVEFNPAAVAEYRLVGYETRLLRRDDFDNDKVDAGDVGSGQTVTALYEITPLGGPRAVSELRYGQAASGAAAGGAAEAREYAFVKIRYKLPKEEASKLITMPVERGTEAARFEDAPREARFATAVASFGELLRGGKHTGKVSYDDVLRIAQGARGDDPFGYRSEFLGLVRAAKTASAMRSNRP